MEAWGIMGYRPEQITMLMSWNTGHRLPAFRERPVSLGSYVLSHTSEP